jgi:PBSX family phage terminase large subunit
LQQRNFANTEHIPGQNSSAIVFYFNIINIIMKYDGIINLIPPSEKALNFLKPKDEPIEIAEGSIRSSKTISCILKLISFMAQPDMLVSDALWGIGGKTLQTCVRNVIRPMCQIFNLLDIEYDHNRLKNELTVNFSPDKTYNIQILGFSDKTSEEVIRGSTLAVLMIDEVNYAPAESLLTALDRTSVKGAKVMLTLNPQDPANWVYSKIIDNVQLQPYINYTHFTLDDNPSLTPEYVERIKSQYPRDSAEYRKKILGIRSANDNSIYGSYLSYNPTYNSFNDSFTNTERPSIGFSEDPSAVNYLDFDSLARSSHHPVLGLDWGAGSVTVAPLCSISADGKILVIDEWFWSADKISSERDEITVDKLLSGCISLVDKWFHGYGKPVPLQSPHDAAIVRSTVKSNPGFSNRLVPLMFKPDLMNNINLLQRLFYNKKILVHSRCRETIRSLQSYSWDSDGERPDKSSYDHPVDALRGPVVYLNKLLGSIPKYSPSGADTVEFERPLINKNSDSLSYYYPQYQ